jgi:integrase
MLSSDQNKEHVMATIKRRAWSTSKGEQREAWVVRYADQDGRWRLKTFARQRAAKEWLPTAQVEVKQRTHRPDSAAPTVSAACEAWIKRGEVGGKERSTIRQRRQHVDLHILPLLGAETKLSRIDVETFRDDLLSSRSRPMAKKVMTSLRSILKQAKMGHLAADVDSIETGGRHRKRLEVGVDIPTKEEVNALLKAATGYIRPLLAVAVFCGLRMSEVRALRWQDVDLDARQLHVRQRADKWQQIGPLKSETSYRSVPLSPFVVNALKDWRGDRIYPGEALVFGTSTGTVQSLPNIWRRHLAPLQVAAGVVDRDGKAKYGAHSFRHFFASWLIDQGFNIKRTSVLLGHSSPVVTLTIYAHLLPADDDHEKFAAGEVALVS